MPIQNLAIGMSLSTKRLETDAKRAQRIAAKRSKQIQREFKKVGGSLALGLGGAVVSMAAITRAIASATTVAKEFNTAMAEVSTLLDDTSSMQNLTKETRAMAVAFGTTAPLEAAARYQVLSGGITDTAKATELLIAANVLSVSGLASVEETTNAIRIVMSAYGDTVGNAADVSDKLFTAMKIGVTTIPALSQSIGGVVGLASKMSIGFEELLAVFSAASRVSKGSSETMDALRGIIAALAKESTQAKEEMEKLNQIAGKNIKFGVQGVRDSGSFIQYLKDVKELVEEAGSDSSWSQLFGRVEALNAISQVTGEGLDDVEAGIIAIANSTDANKDAFVKMFVTPQKQLDVVTAKFNDLKITIGNALLPAIVNAATELGNMTQSVDGSSGAFSGIATVIKGFVGGLILIIGVAKAVGSAVLGLGIGIVSTFRAILAPVTAAIQTIVEASSALANGDFGGVRDALGSTFSKASSEFEDAIEQLNTAMNFVADDGGKALEDAFASIYRVMEGAKIAIPDIVNEMESLGATAEQIDVALKKMTLADSLGLTVKQLENIQTAGNAAFEALRTPMEAAYAEFVKIDAILVAYLGTLKAGTQRHDEITEAIERNHKAWWDNAEAIRANGKELTAVERAAKGVFDSLRTPLEKLRAEYVSNRAVLKAHLAGLTKGTAEYDAYTDALRRNALAFVAEGKAIRDATTPLEEFNKRMQEQIDSASGLYTAHEQRINQLEEEALALFNATGEQERYNEARAKIAELNAASGSLGFGYNSIEEIIIKGFEKGAKAFGKEVQKVWQGNNGTNRLEFAGQAAGYAGDLINTFKEARKSGKTVQEALNDVAANSGVPQLQAIAAIRSLINDLTGGRFFGTTFAVDKTVANLGVDGGGVFGGTTTFESKKKSFFRGTKRRETTDPLTAEARKSLEDLFDSIAEAIGDASRALAVQIPEIIGGGFTREFDKDNNLVKEFSTVMGRVFEESFEDFGQRLVAENLIATIAERFEEVGDIAERWREDANKLLEGASLLLVIAGEIKSGFNLFELGMSATVDVIEELNYAGEELSDTYLRLKQDFELLQRATKLMGVELGLGREEFVRFAASIEEAAGGLDRATELWVSFFETFTTANERAVTDMKTAVDKQAELLAGIGTDAEGFAEAFKAALPTLSAEDIATWLKAGEAIATVIKLEDILRQQREELQDIFGDTGVFSAFQMAVIEMNRELDEALRAAKNLGAGERELALIRKHSERAMKRMVSSLRADTAAMANAYLEGMSEGQLGFLEEEAARLSSISNERRQAYQAELKAVQQLKEFADSLLLNDALTPLTPAEQLAEARSQFDSTVRQARSGDLDAMQRLPGLASSFLEIARGFYASSSDYTDIFNDVQAGLRGVSAGSEMGTLTAELAAVEGEIALLRESISANSQAMMDFQKAMQITALLENIVALAAYDNASVTEMAENFGLDLDALTSQLSDLGISGFDPDAILARQEENFAFQTAMGKDMSDINVGVGDLGTKVDMREAGDEKRHDELWEAQKETNRLLNRIIDEKLLRAA